MKQCTWRQKQQEKSCCHEISGESRTFIPSRPALKDGKTEQLIGWAFGAGLYFNMVLAQHQHGPGATWSWCGPGKLSWCHRSPGAVVLVPWFWCVRGPGLSWVVLGGPEWSWVVLGGH